MQVEDAQLVSRCLAGDTVAYETLVHKHQGAVFATAFYYTRQYGAAEDIAQDTFLTAYRSLPRLKDPEAFAAWLKGIATRTATNWLRRHAKGSEAEIPIPSRRTLSIEDARLGPRGALERKERVERVHRAIDSLPERYRLPVVLRYLQEMSYSEISTYTGETKDEVRGLLQRAGRQLRDVLNDMDSSSEGENAWHPVRK